MAPIWASTKGPSSAWSVPYMYPNPPPGRAQSWRLSAKSAATDTGTRPELPPEKLTRCRANKPAVDASPKKGLVADAQRGPIEAESPRNLSAQPVLPSGRASLGARPLAWDGMVWRRGGRWGG